ncbi:MAG TPA: endo-1,3-alpha-glucanase family glycosylhydrolase, partial [Anaerolineales bacterium]|nr:endo-1,3-alpha-glucanase family glycosylhydrolase [Anaerolineales bacterium]
TDANGCNAVSNYAGNQLLDVPARLVSQDDPGAIEADIRLAKGAGVAGFWLNWSGDGTTTQTRNSVTYTPRLAEAFAASNRVGGFRNWVSYKAASMPSAAYIINDLNFLYNQFKNETAWERIDGKPVVTFTGSRKYSDADVLRISQAVRDRMFLVGDETRATLTPTRIAMFDAITYYWSTQDPYGNPQSFNQIKEMGDKVHAAGKRWYAPLNPGYNSSLLDGGTCIPRRNGDTLRSVWNGNLASRPDGWGMISWNEIAENTHIKPMQKWGNTYLNVLSSLIGVSAPPPAPTATLVAPPTATLVAPPTATLVVPTVASTAMPAPATPTAPPASATTIDDKNAGVILSSGWQTMSTSNAYGGSYRETIQNGATATIPFTGQSFSLIYKGGITFSKFDVYVDGALVGTLDQKLGAATYQVRWDYPGQLAAGNHTIKLVFKVTSATVNRGSLDAVIVR